MARFTTDCRQPGQPEISFDVDLEGLSQKPADHLIATIEEMIKRGAVIHSQHLIQLGWTLLRVTTEQDGSLSLYEPDGKSIPIEYRRGITESIRQMLLQLWHADSYGLDRDWLALPSIRHSVIACTRLGDSAGVFLSRSAPVDQLDSGWFIGCEDTSHDHNDPSALVRVSLYEAFIKKPVLAPWVGFPATTTILISPGSHPEVYVADQPCELVKDSFVDQALHNPDEAPSSSPDPGR